VDWPYEIAERDHEIQNPTSAEKIRLLGEYLRLDRESRVLDVACGKAGPAVILATAFGCSITGIELRAGFADEGRARVSAAGLESRSESRSGVGGRCRRAPTMKGTSSSLAQAIASPRRASR
jgi:protein-L-isoaspartate O-methyltransferase